MDSIEHEGIVAEVGDIYVIVSIENVSACAACRAQGACGMSEMIEKNIKVERNGLSVEVGEKVILVGTIRNALFAVLWSYVIPSILILSILPCTLLLGLGEMLSILFALLIIVLYFFSIYLFRDKFERKIKFRIKTQLNKKK